MYQLFKLLFFSFTIFALSSCSQSLLQSGSINPRQTILEMQVNQEDPALIEAYENAIQNLEKNTLEAQYTASERSMVYNVGTRTPAYYDSVQAIKLYSHFDWSSDGCSVPTALGLGLKSEFLPACKVHDFGYRNFSDYRMGDEDYRHLLDDAFLGNMVDICNSKSLLSRVACRTGAYVYYSAVRLRGEPSFD